MSKKIRILFISPLPPPYYGSAMSSKECLNILKSSKEFDIKNIKINIAGKMEDVGKISFKKLFSVKKVNKNIQNSLENFNPEIVYIMPATSKIGLLKDFYFISKIKKISKKKILYHIRARITVKDKANPIKKYIYKKIFEGSSAIVLDESLKKDVLDFVPENNIYVLPNSIKNELSNKQFIEMTQASKQASKFKILFISNMDRQKGWPKLLEACKILKGKNLEFECNFVGAWQNKKDEKYFKKFVDNNELEKNINYLGRKTGKDKNEILKNSDILVFPTEYKLETFGRVILEAMMFGLPVIANGIASIPSTIKNNKTGYVLGKNNPEEIAEKIKKLYENPKLRKNMGINARKRFLKYYTYEKYQNKFLEILNKLK